MWILVIFYLILNLEAMTALGKQVLYDYPIPIRPYISVYGLYGI